MILSKKSVSDTLTVIDCRDRVLRVSHIPVIVSNAASFSRDVLEVKNELVILYLWGHQCPNCEIFAAHLPKVLDELGDVPARVVKINVYEESSVATDLAVFGIPAFFLFRDGKKLGRMSEFRGLRFFVDVVRENLPPAASTSAS